MARHLLQTNARCDLLILLGKRFLDKMVSRNALRMKLLAFTPRHLTVWPIDTTSASIACDDAGFCFNHLEWC